MPRPREPYGHPLTEAIRNAFPWFLRDAPYFFFAWENQSLFGAALGLKFGVRGFNAVS